MTRKVVRHHKYRDIVLLVDKIEDNYYIDTNILSIGGVGWSYFGMEKIQPYEYAVPSEFVSGVLPPKTSS